MSTTVRWMVGGLSVVFAFMTGALPVVTHLSPSGTLISWIIVAVCLAFALTCFVRSFYGLMVRLLGGIFFLGYVGCAYLQISAPHSASYASSTSLSSLNEARGLLLGLVLFGVPGFYMALTGKIPQWMDNKNRKRPA